MLVTSYADDGSRAQQLRILYAKRLAGEISMPFSNLSNPLHIGVGDDAPS
jgi:hypothetical protein